MASSAEVSVFCVHLHKRSVDYCDLLYALFCCLSMKFLLTGINCFAGYKVPAN